MYFPEGDLFLSFLDQLTHVLIGSMADGATCVSHVVDQDSHTVLHIAHQNHPVHFICFLSLFVNQSKLHIQPVRN